jgi:hypothetical protein
VVLQQVERALEQRIEVGRLHRPARSLGAREVEQPVHDVRCATDFALDDLEILARLRIGASPEARDEITDTHAPIVASGLLISCMTPAASWPTAASFSVWCIARWMARVSVRSSPIVMTCEISPPSRRIGRRVVR